MPVLVHLQRAQLLKDDLWPERSCLRQRPWNRDTTASPAGPSVIPATPLWEALLSPICWGRTTGSGGSRSTPRAPPGGPGSLNSVIRAFSAGRRIQEVGSGCLCQSPRSSFVAKSLVSSPCMCPGHTVQLLHLQGLSAVFHPIQNPGPLLDLRLRHLLLHIFRV